MEDKKLKLTSKEKKAKKKQLKAQKLAAKKEKQRKRIENRSKKNTRWFYFFILFLIAIIILSLWEGCKRNQLYKSQKKELDSLAYSEAFYKSKYHEKDSSLNVLLSGYNSLLQQNIENSKEITDSKSELLRLQKIVYFQDSILRHVQEIIGIALSSYQSKDEIAIEMIDGKLYITMRNKLLFPSGSSNIQSKGVTALSTLAKVLKENPNIDITIEGHTDNVPMSSNDKIYKDNWDLSTARAIAITRLLVDKYEIRPERLSASGRSMYYPVAPNTTAEGRARNRRIEIILTPNYLYRFCH